MSHKNKIKSHPTVFLVWETISLKYTSQFHANFKAVWQKTNTEIHYNMDFTSLLISSPPKILSKGFLSQKGNMWAFDASLQSDSAVSPHTLLQKSWKTFKRRQLERGKGYWQRACDYCQNKDRSRIIVDDQGMYMSEVSSPQLGWRPSLNLLELD